jgi:hypothetical protein
VSLIEKELDTTLEIIDKTPLDGAACMLKDISKGGDINAERF